MGAVDIASLDADLHEADIETLERRVVQMALEQTDLSPRELAVRFTDEKRYFISEATVYRLLKAHDLFTS